MLIFADLSNNFNGFYRSFKQKDRVYFQYCINDIIVQTGIVLIKNEKFVGWIRKNHFINVFSLLQNEPNVVEVIIFRKRKV